MYISHVLDWSAVGPRETLEEQENAEKRALMDKPRCGSILPQSSKAPSKSSLFMFTHVPKHRISLCRYRVEEEKERVARGGAENEKPGGDAIEMPEVPLTAEQISQNMIKWKPYLAYVDDLMSKALIQAVSSRYR